MKQAQTQNSAQLRSMLLDPAVNLVFQRMSKEMEESQEKLKQTQNELSAWKFTPDRCLFPILITLLILTKSLPTWHGRASHVLYPIFSVIPNVRFWPYHCGPMCLMRTGKCRRQTFILSDPETLSRTLRLALPETELGRSYWHAHCLLSAGHPSCLSYPDCT